MLKEKNIEKKKEDLLLNQIGKSLALFKVSLSQNISKELANFRKQMLKKGKD